MSSQILQMLMLELKLSNSLSVDYIVKHTLQIIPGNYYENARASKLCW